MDKFLVYLKGEGVYGVAHEVVDGISCTYFIDGFELNDFFELNEYNLISYLES